MVVVCMLFLKTEIFSFSAILKLRKLGFEAKILPKALEKIIESCKVMISETYVGAIFMSSFTISAVFSSLLQRMKSGFNAFIF